MRSPSDIFTKFVAPQFFESKMDKDAVILASPNHPRQLELAMEYLGIVLEDFKEIPFKFDKEELLNGKIVEPYFVQSGFNDVMNSFVGKLVESAYKFVNSGNYYQSFKKSVEGSDKALQKKLKFLQNVSDLYNSDEESHSNESVSEGDLSQYIKNTMDQFINRISQSYNIVKNSKILKNKDKYSPFSMGLKYLHHEVHDMKIDKKPAGVEPGFLGIISEEVMAYLADRFKDNPLGLKQYIAKYNADILKIYADCKEELPSYMFKLVYEASKSAIKAAAQYQPVDVEISKEDIQRTNKYKTAGPKFMKEFVVTGFKLAKKGKSTDKSMDAILETIVTNIMGMLMPVTHFTLLKRKYPNGALQLVLFSKMLKNFEEFGKTKSKELVRFGANDDENNYRGRKLLIPRNGIESVTDDRIEGLGTYNIPIKFSNDFDKMGSKLQNNLLIASVPDKRTGKVTYQFIGIDYGHTLQKPNQLIGKLLPDGRFQQPSIINPLTDHIFKNFSALSDVPLSEVMEGAANLAKMGGYSGPKQKPADKTVGESQRVINEMIEIFESLSKKEPQYAKEYSHFIVELEALKVRMNGGRKNGRYVKGDLDRYYKKFQAYMYHKPKAVDLADNLKKLCASAEFKTSLRSQNRKHGLRHLRVTDYSYQDFWAIDLTEGVYTLTSCSRATQYAELIVDWAKSNNKVDVSIVNEEIAISFASDDLEEALTLFSEDEIKMRYHKVDHIEIQKAYQELDLRDLVRAPWFVEKNADISLGVHPNNPTVYCLKVKPMASKKMDPELSKIIEETFSQPFLNGEFIYHFSSSDVDAVLELWRSVQNTYDKKHSTAQVSTISAVLGCLFTNVQIDDYQDNTGNLKVALKNYQYFLKQEKRSLSSPDILTWLTLSIYQSVADTLNSSFNDNSSASLLNFVSDFNEKLPFINDKNKNKLILIKNFRSRLLKRKNYLNGSEDANELKHLNTLLESLNAVLEKGTSDSETKRFT